MFYFLIDHLSVKFSISIGIEHTIKYFLFMLIILTDKDNICSSFNSTYTHIFEGIVFRNSPHFHIIC